MKLINALVLDTQSEYNGQVVEILIEEGKIKEIGKKVNDAEQTIDLEGAYVTPGFVDMFANFCEPGDEHRETIFSGTQAALAGGYTDVCLIPNTGTPVDNKSTINFIKGRQQEVTLHPYGAVSEQCKGENLTEILDLNENGAVAFTDGVHPIFNSELLLKALQYVQKFDGLVMVRPKDEGLSRHFQMHEGPTSTTLGMVGEPGLSEEITIIRDLEILKHVGGRIHFSQISSAKAVELIRKAKAEGLKVTCDVSIHHLIFTDEDLVSFDTNFKMDPPLRSEADKDALIAGLEDDTIDAIVSSHQPYDVECKNLEFDLADFGVIGLQTVVPAIVSLKEQISLEKVIGKLTAGPRKVLGFDTSSVEIGMPATLTIIDEKMEWALNESTNQSLSTNSPYWKQPLKGVAKGIVNQGKLYLNK